MYILSILSIETWPVDHQLHITRAARYSSNAGHWIAPDEWLRIVDSDPELQLAGYNGPYFTLWKGSAKTAEAWFDWHNGNVFAKNADELTIRKMVELAGRLNAKLQGVDGEVYLENGQCVELPAPTDDSAAENARRPWITRLAALLCVGVFLGLATQNQNDSDALAKFGVLPGSAIWGGHYWALIASVFGHFELWHLAFNVYWLWVLGSRLEGAIGSSRYLGFFLASAFVSSSLQLAASGDCGIGMSGVVYAIFGYMWFARAHYPEFNAVLDTRTIQIFFLWLVGCIVLTYMDTWNVANTAHVAGLVFGSALAGWLERRWPRTAIATLVLLVTASVVALYWCPWSVAWLSTKAYQAHVAEEYEQAIGLYSRVIDREPRNAWAYWNRGEVHEALGHAKQAEDDMSQAKKLDPSLAEESE